jgi:hypothetical protein
MVNEKQGKVYEPKPVYIRGLVRSVIRAEVARQFGNHGVSKNMSDNFKSIKGKTTTPKQGKRKRKFRFKKGKR